MTRSTSRSRRRPEVVFDGAVFRVTQRGRSVDVPALRESDEEFLVELDDVTHWAASGESEAQEISIEELGDILEAIEDFAEDQGFAISFE